VRYIGGLPRKPIALGDVRRVVAVAACCLLAALTPFSIGFSAAVLGLVTLALAIWLVVRSQWSARTRVTASLAVLVVPIALFIGLLAASALTNYYG
jgi:hypothetical protein